MCPAYSHIFDSELNNILEFKDNMFKLKHKKIIALRLHVDKNSTCPEISGISNRFFNYLNEIIQNINENHKLYKDKEFKDQYNEKYNIYQIELKTAKERWLSSINAPTPPSTIKI